MPVLSADKKRTTRLEKQNGDKIILKSRCCYKEKKSFGVHGT